MSTVADERNARAPWLLSAPALMLFVGVLLIPLAMTVMLSFHDWGQYKGIEPVFILKNWREICDRSLLRRDVPAHVPDRDPDHAAHGRARRARSLHPQPHEAAAGKSIFLLVILGPLLISVVARTLGWALLFGGNNGLVNKLLMSAGVIRSPIPFMFTETGMVVALAHVLMPFMVLSVWAALQRLDPQIENAAMSLGAGPVHRAPPHRAAADHAGRAVGRDHRVRARRPAPSRRPRSSAAGGSRSRRRSPTTNSSTR